MPATSAEYDALYAAVCAAPDEDTPRLALADWLDEHDDPHRAGYIRAEVQIRRLSETDPHAAAAFHACASVGTHDWPRYHDPAEVSPAVARLAELAKQSAKHANKAAARWKAVTPKRASGSIYHFERGFPHGVWVTNPKQYAEKQPPENLPGHSLAVKADDARLDALFACRNFAEARGLSLWGVNSAEPVREVGAQRAVRNVRSLYMRTDGATTEALAAIAEQPNWCALESLNAYTFSEKADLPASFARAAHLRTLTTLMLGVGGVSDAGMAALSRLKLSRLRRLEVGYNKVGPAGAKAVVAGHFPELRHLDVHSNAIRDDGAAALADGHAKLPLLAVLNLQGNRITDPKLLAALVAGPCFPNLVGLSLRENRTERLDAKTLAAPGRGPTLRFLSFRHCGLSAKAAEALASAPSLANLLCIDLAGCEVGNAGAKAIASSTWQRLSCLDLAQNGITADGVKALLAWPGVARLQYLHLGQNPIGIAGAKALAACDALKKCRKLVVPYDDKLLPASGRELLRAKFGRRLDF